jgi:hypothetical protein
MGDRGRKLAREDLEAMRQEFVVGERAGSLDDDLHQIRRSAKLGVSPEDWARARKLDGTYFSDLAKYHSFGGCTACSWYRRVVQDRARHPLRTPGPATLPVGSGLRYLPPPYRPDPTVLLHRHTVWGQGALLALSTS